MTRISLHELKQTNADVFALSKWSATELKSFPFISQCRPTFGTFEDSLRYIHTDSLRHLRKSLAEEVISWISE